MTKKPYPNASRVSRSSGARPPRRRGAATATASPSAGDSGARLPAAKVRRHTVRPPLSNHFALLDPGDDDHPVDLMVDRIPTITRRARRLRSLAREVQRRLGDDALFLRHEDERLEQQVAREEVYFNCGFEHGHLASRASRHAVMSPASKRFGDKLQALLATTDLPDLATAALMLDYVRALLIPLEPSPAGVSASSARRTLSRNRAGQP
jgi:hypothetical protein